MTLGESWANAHGEYSGGNGCNDCATGNGCECARRCKSKSKRKTEEKVQTAYAIGFAVCLVLVLLVWSVWPMMMGAVESFKSKFSKFGDRSGFDAAGAGASPDAATSAAQAAQAAYQISQQQQWDAKVASATAAQQKLLTPQQMAAQQAAVRSLSQYGNHHLSNGYIAGLQNHPGATDGSQLSMKYQTEFDHSGAAALSGTDTFQSYGQKFANLAADAHASGFGQPGAHASGFGQPGAHASGFGQPGAHASGFAGHDGHASGFAGHGLHEPASASGFAALKSARFGQPGPSSASGFAALQSKGGFVGGVASQYPTEWPGTSRDDDVTEMTLRGGVSDYVASLAAAAPTAHPSAASGFANSNW